jgi:putative oxidoreductase
MAKQANVSGEPQLLIPALAPFYVWARDFSWLVIRVTVGGVLLVHGINKVMGPGVGAFAAGLAKRGIEPSLLFAYVVFFNETVGAVFLAVGFLTRIVGPMIAIEFVIITFIAHFPNGFAWTSPHGGFEYPLLWGLVIFAVSLRGGGPWSVDRLIGKEL